MKCVAEYSSAEGRQVLEKLGLYSTLKDALAAPHLVVRRGVSRELKAHVGAVLARSGWAFDIRLGSGSQVSLSAFHHLGAGVQVQTGNVARAFYDLLKLQSMFDQERMKVGVMLLPTKAAARTLGDNIANFDRTRLEHDYYFSNAIDLPLMMFAFE